MKALLAATVVSSLALCGSASAATADGSYKGSTDEGRSAFAQVKKGKVSGSTAVMTRCRNSDGTYRFATDFIVFKGAKLKGSKFKYSEKGDESNGKATYELGGTVKGKKMTFSVKEFFRNGCIAFDLSAKLKRK